MPAALTNGSIACMFKIGCVDEEKACKGIQRKQGERMDRNLTMKEALRSLSLETYVQGGTLMRCLPTDLWLLSGQAVAHADEMWRDGGLEVLTFTYDGFAVNVTMQQQGSVQLFDSIDVWDVTDDVIVAAGRVLTAQALEQWAAECGVSLHRFEMVEERVYLWPNAVTVHYRPQREQWLLTKIAGACRSYEDTLASLRLMARGS